MIDICKLHWDREHTNLAGGSVMTNINRRLDLQNAEFDALTELAKQWEALSRVPIVDDDYPDYRRRYEGAMRAFVVAIKANGRI